MKIPAHFVIHYLVRLILSAGVSAILLYLLIHLVSLEIQGNEQLDMRRILSTTYLPWVSAFLLLHLIGVILRAVRYRILLIAGKEPNLPTFLQLVLVTGFRNMMVDLLPARVGELGYVALLNRVYGVRISSCLSSLILSIAFSFAALVVLLVGLVCWQAVTDEVSAWALWAAFTSAIICFIGMAALLYLLPNLVRYLQSRCVSGSSHGFFENVLSRLAIVLEQMSNAITGIKQPGIIIQVLGISLLIRILKYAGMLLLFMAVARSNFPQLLDVPLQSICIALIGAEVAASLPLPTLMGFGIYEAGGTLIFSAFDIPLQVGLFALLATHIWSQLVDYLFGVFCLVIVFSLAPRRSDKSFKISSILFKSK